ncbi:MAG: hypothetical protein HY808_05350 [Nitrospirae bacterium]|nr:hypothetical protein [Nitrospirota bacterium]
MAQVAQNTSAIKKRPSTKTWFIVHVIVPLLPVCLGVLVRFISNPVFSLATFKAADFALSVGLVVAFARQSLLNSERVLSNSDEEEEIAGGAAMLLSFLFTCFVLYAITESFDSIVNGRQIKEMSDSLVWANCVAFIVSTIALFQVIRIQRSFKLKTRIL